MHVFYQPDILSEEITLSEEESKHCVRVLRLANGDSVYLTNGKGLKARATIAEAHPKKCVLHIEEKTQQEKLHDYFLHLIVAPTKNFDRMEWLIEKAIESGIDRITFIEAANSERAKVNLERCEKVAVSAMKQSKQWHLPQIDNLVKFSEALNLAEQEALKLIAYCPTSRSEFITQIFSDNKSFCICIGPEGDFTQEEIDLANKSGFKNVSLGKSILRTETAALFACMAVKAYK